MESSDFTEMESLLGIKLPTEYRRVMAKEGEELARLARRLNAKIDDSREVFADRDTVLRLNIWERSKNSGTGYAFPNWWRKFLIVGTNGGGDFYCLRLDNKPGIWLIGSDCGDEPEKDERSLRELVTGLINGFREEMKNPELHVGIPYIEVKEWIKLKRAYPQVKDLRDDFWQIHKKSDQAFDKAKKAGKRPTRIYIFADEFVWWCKSNERLPNSANLAKFAAMKLQEEHPWLATNDSSSL